MEIHMSNNAGDIREAVKRATLKAENADEANFLAALCETILNGQPVIMPVVDMVFSTDPRYTVSIEETV